MKNNKKKTDAHTSTCKHRLVQVGGNNIRWHQLGNSEMHKEGFLIWVQLNKKHTPRTLHSYVCKSKSVQIWINNSLIHTHGTSTDYCLNKVRIATNDVVKSPFFWYKGWFLFLIFIPCQNGSNVDYFAETKYNKEKKQNSISKPLLLHIK